MNKISLSCALLACIFTPVAWAVATDNNEQSWPELSLGDLMKVGVESASRKNQALSNTAAAVFVISASDIRRSGALSIPEVLRLAPGVEAARLSNNRWAVSIRGFNGLMANKLLVLVDGRSIYSSLFGGIIWEAENLPMEEISRIEVIRGSAGQAWGSNAVNGVINIITKRSQDTQGWLVDSHVGTETGRAGLALRYGTKLDDGSALRITLNEQRRDGGKELDGEHAQDEWNDSSLSFRYDMADGMDTRWLASGRIYDSQIGEAWLVPTLDMTTAYNPAEYGAARLVPFASSKNGGDLLGRYEHFTDSGGEVRVQTYAEKFHGENAGAIHDHTTFDIDAQYRFMLNDAHDIVWGGNYRRTGNHLTTRPAGFLTTTNPDVTISLASVFAQDEWTVIPHLFNVQAGLRIERQTFGGTAPQPSIRTLWTPNELHSFWLAWSKTVRSPSMVERTVGAYPGAIPASGPGSLPVLLYAEPGEQSGFGNEKVRTIEAGHRAQWTPTFYSDLSAYVSKYDGIFGVLSSTMTANAAAGFTGLPVDPSCSAALTEFGLAAGAPGLCMTMSRGNSLPVRTRGLELATEWSPLPDWRLQINASRMWLDGGPDTSGIVYGNSPNFQGAVRSSYNFTADRHFDIWLRRVGGLSNTGFFSGTVGTTPIPARNELDLRFAEQISETLELSLTLQDLLSRQQLNFYPDYTPSLPVVPQRTIYLKALWHGR